MRCAGAELLLLSWFLLLLLLSGVLRCQLIGHTACHGGKSNVQLFAFFRDDFLVHRVKLRSDVSFKQQSEDGRKERLLHQKILQILTLPKNVPTRCYCDYSHLENESSIETEKETLVYFEFIQCLLFFVNIVEVAGEEIRWQVQFNRTHLIFVFFA